MFDAKYDECVSIELVRSQGGKSLSNCGSASVGECNRVI